MTAIWIWCSIFIIFFRFHFTRWHPLLELLLCLYRVYPFLIFFVVCKHPSLLFVFLRSMWTHFQIHQINIYANSKQLWHGTNEICHINFRLIVLKRTKTEIRMITICSIKCAQQVSGLFNSNVMRVTFDEWPIFLHRTTQSIIHWCYPMWMNKIWKQIDKLTIAELFAVEYYVISKILDWFVRAQDQQLDHIFQDQTVNLCAHKIEKVNSHGINVSFDFSLCHTHEFFDEEINHNFQMQTHPNVKPSKRQYSNR